MCILQAVTALDETSSGGVRQEMTPQEVPEVGSLVLTTSDHELASLYNSFLYLWDKLSAAAADEWRVWVDEGMPDLAVFVSKTGKSIAVIGRAEKRLVVAAARYLLAACPDCELELNPTAKEAFDQLHEKYSPA
jgi:hypothetical protein